MPTVASCTSAASLDSSDGGSSVGSRRRKAFSFLRRKKDRDPNSRRTGIGRRRLFRRKLSPTATSYLALDEPSSTSLLVSDDDDSSSVITDIGGSPEPSLSTEANKEEGSSANENLAVILEEAPADDLSKERSFLQLGVKECPGNVSTALPVTPERAPPPAAVTPSPADRGQVRAGLAPVDDQGATLTPVRAPERQAANNGCSLASVLEEWDSLSLSTEKKGDAADDWRKKDDDALSNERAPQNATRHLPTLLQENSSLKLCKLSHADPWNGTTA